MGKDYRESLKVLEDYRPRPFIESVIAVRGLGSPDAVRSIVETVEANGGQINLTLKATWEEVLLDGRQLRLFGPGGYAPQDEAPEQAYEDGPATRSQMPSEGGPAAIHRIYQNATEQPGGLPGQYVPVGASDEVGNNVTFDELGAVKTAPGRWETSPTPPGDGEQIYSQEIWRDPDGAITYRPVGLSGPFAASLAVDPSTGEVLSVSLDPSTNEARIPGRETTAVSFTDKMAPALRDAAARLSDLPEGVDRMSIRLPDGEEIDVTPDSMAEVSARVAARASTADPL